MFKASSSRLLRSIIHVASILLTVGISTAEAQVTSDNTVGTQVSNEGNVAEITGGETRGDNLFHSFEDFSVTTGNEAFFNNAESIDNIFSRVTGGNISNIDGLIRANGSASLFLINPAGIMFGENASLGLGGSFYGSTADSILFEGGEFSADLDNPPLLTVNAPIGFSFRDNPEDINNDGATLRVRPEQTLGLLGGNLNFDDGLIGGIGGNVELGSLSESGTVDLNEDGSLNFPESIARGDISFVNTGTIFVLGEEGGTININAQNLSLNSDSNIFAGIDTDSGSAQAQAGDLTINLTGDLTVDNSTIGNSNEGRGNIGKVAIDVRNLFFNNGGRIFSFSTGAGNIGDIAVTATEDISFDGVGSLTSFNSGISVFLSEAATGGDVGEINLTAQNLTLTNSGSISNSVETNSNSGDITLDIADTIRIDGVGSVPRNDGTTTELPSSIESDLSNGDGNSGDININAQSLVLNDEGGISAVNFGRGDSGNININVNSLSITEAGRINGGINGAGNGGNINVNAKDRVSVIGNDSLFSSIDVDIRENATGRAGNIKIDTPQLVLQDAFISADVIGDGEGGTIDISASDSIELSNSSLIQADVSENSTGNGGDLNIVTGRLTLSDDSQIGATTLGNGNAGNVNISADDSIAISGVGELSRSGIFANAIIEDGKGGNIDITTGELTISDGAVIIAGNFSSLGSTEPGTGEPGKITISADTLNLESEGRIEARTQAETGTGANINLQVADTISLGGNSFISAEALGNANGGNLNIDTNFVIAFEGNNDIIASADRGQGGNIDITAESLLGIRERALDPFTNDINASSEFGLDGNIFISTLDVDPIQGTAELSTEVVDTGETVAQVCNASRNVANSNSLTVGGKGGIPSIPGSPLNSASLVGETPAESIAMPKPLKTGRGNIQPARGIKVREDGQITLTAYRTNAKGDRFIEKYSSCG